jgi:polysaccharide deacetylase family protein (PEP-CTERM system associated)
MMSGLKQVSEPAQVFSDQNALTVDVEDYFQVSAFEPFISRDDWESFECRMPANIDRILALFDQAGVKGTFFVLGWLAERYPEVLRQIAASGHEIASHGYQHVQVRDQNESEFRQDVDRTKKLLEDISGTGVLGYRAASFSIDASNRWARNILAETGHQYSSSIFPIRHDRYGMSDAPRFPCRETDSGIVELPVTTAEIGGTRIPCGGGGYFRLLPYAVTRWGIRRVNRVNGQPAIFYFHPWEIDPDQPRQKKLDGLSRFRHYVNLKNTEGKLQRLLTDFKWGTIADTYGAVF